MRKPAFVICNLIKDIDLLAVTFFSCIAITIFMHLLWQCGYTETDCFVSALVGNPEDRFLMT